MNFKKLLIGGAVGALMLGAVAVSAFAANNGTTVYRFANEPFNYKQCYTTGGFFPGPAATFGQDVCVQYTANNSETVRYQSGNVEWSLIQIGTATVTSQNTGDVLYQGPFQVQEHARDLGDNAGCTTSDHHAYLGHCTSAYTNLDWLRYNWSITGNSVYDFTLTISSPGQYCFNSPQGGEFGTDCPVH